VRSLSPSPSTLSPLSLSLSLSLPLSRSPVAAKRARCNLYARPKSGPIFRCGAFLGTDGDEPVGAAGRRGEGGCDVAA
jgi:hypothetical protein